MATILTKKSDTASSVPLVADLTNAAGGAELAVNTADKRLFTKTSGGAVVELGTNPSSLTLPNGSANGIPYLNASKVLTSGSALTFDGSNFVVNPTNTQFYVGSSFAKIQNNAGASASFIMADTSDSATIKNVGSSIAFINSASEGMRLTSTGLGIGTATPINTAAGRGNVTINGSSSAILELGVAGSGRGFLYADGTHTELDSTGYLQLNTNGSERARIDSSGNFLVGTTSALAKVTLANSSTTTANVRADNGSASISGRNFYSTYTGSGNNNTTAIHYAAYDGSLGAEVFRVYGNGNVVNTNNSYGAISDLKLKENVVDATSKLSGLMQVRVVNYNLKTDPEHKQLGVVAQELEQVFPGMVEESADRDLEGNDLGTTTKSVKYSVFVPMLIKAIQEQQAIIEQLKADVAALKAAP